MPEITGPGALIISEQQPQVSSISPRKMNREAVASIILIVVALVLASLSLFLPWWHIDSSFKGEGIPPPTFSWDFSASMFCYKSGNTYLCKPYSEISSTGGGWNAVKGSLGLGFVLIVLGIAMSASTIALIVASLKREKVRIAAIALGILGSIVCLGAVLYVFATLPGAFTSDYKISSPSSTWSVSGFFGPTLVAIDNGIATGTMTYNHYGLLGWWLAVLSAVILIVGVILALRSTRTAKTGSPKPAQDIVK